MWTAVHDGHPVWALFAVDSEAALLPVYKRVEPLQEGYSQDEVWVHGRNSQSQIEPDSVHSHVDVHELSAGYCVT